jgi:hypothetical protein
VPRVALSPICVVPILAASLFAEDPVALLQRARERIIDNIDHIPNYTCVQTVSRRQFRQIGFLNRRPTCPAILDERAQRTRSHLKLASANRLRLDVALSGGHEIFSWAGDKRFENEDVHQLVGSGMTGTGDFGAFTISIFASDSALYEFRGETKAGAATLAEYRYRVSRELSHYTMRAGIHLATMAYAGRFWIDTGSSDLIKLTVQVDEPPPESGICQVVSTMEYQRIPIGSERFLLPRKSTLSMVDRGGDESLNTIEYSSCRAYSAESILRFESAAAGSEDRSAITPPAMPPRLRVSIKLSSTIDSRTAVAGDVVRGVLAKPIRDQNGKTLVPAGAPVAGRLTRMEERWVPSHCFAVGLRFDAVELNGHEIPLALSPLPVAGDDPEARNQLRPRGAEIALPPIERRPGVGSFLFGRKAPLILGEKFQSDWETR